MADTEEVPATWLSLGLGESYSGAKVSNDNDNISNSRSEKSSWSKKEKTIELKDHYDHEANKHNIMGRSSSYGRKKLKLTEEQLTLLEESFRLRSNPSLMQKQKLADELNLKPRQVEVWFQNRRARTKLKQKVENNHDLMEELRRLSDENEKLHRHLQECYRCIREAKLAAPSRSASPPSGLHRL